MMYSYFFLFHLSLVTTHLWYSGPQMEKLYSAALAFYWFLKHTMLFHTSGLLFLLLLLIPSSVQAWKSHFCLNNTSSKKLSQYTKHSLLPVMSSYSSISSIAILSICNRLICLLLFCFFATKKALTRAGSFLVLLTNVTQCPEQCLLTGTQVIVERRDNAS